MRLLTNRRDRKGEKKKANHDEVLGEEKREGEGRGRIPATVREEDGEEKRRAPPMLALPFTFTFESASVTTTPVAIWRLGTSNDVFANTKRKKKIFDVEKEEE